MPVYYVTTNQIGESSQDNTYANTPFLCLRSHSLIGYLAQKLTSPLFWERVYNLLILSKNMISAQNPSMSTLCAHMLDNQPGLLRASHLSQFVGKSMRMA